MDGSTPFVRPASERTRKLSALAVDEKLIYQVIEEAANKGIWLRDIRAKSNLEQKRVLKIIKTLQSRQYIKAVNSVVVSANTRAH